MNTQRLIMMGAVSLALAASHAQAQLAMTWYSIDCGGSVAQSGQLSMRGTLGQPDAGVQTGGTLTFTGGFLQSFTPWCLADFNKDGVVDFFDYLDFVAAFSQGEDIADFNLDGVLDFFDYLDFVSAFSAAC
jgi:hypothetical protein